MGYEDLTGWKAAVAEGHPPEKPTLLKEYLPDRIKSEGERKYTFTISTGAIDRDRDTVSVEGWSLDNYRKNPVVLWAHDYAGLPVGRAESIIARNGQLIARMQFVPGEVYPFAETVRQLIDGGWVKATSVGFRPLKWAINEERGGYDFEEQELLEFSLVPVPSNPEALVQARASGMDVAPLKDWALKVLDSYQLSDEEKADAAKVLKLATGDPVSVTVAGAPLEPIGAPHAAEKSGEEPEPAIPVVKRGRVLSAQTEAHIRNARGHSDEIAKALDEVLASVEELCNDDEDEKSVKTEDDTAETVTREPRLVVYRPEEPRKHTINPESVAKAVRDAVQAEVRRLRGRLD
jgi:HK97 family phage prohead protease